MNKFLFDLNNFDAPNVEEEESVEEYVEPPPPTFSEDDLEASKAVAHATGRNEGMREERESRDQYVADTLRAISENFENLSAAELYREKQYEEESVRLALKIIDALAPSLKTRLGEEALKMSLREVLQTQAGQSEVKIEVHPDCANDIDKLIGEIWSDKDNTPRYKIMADSTLENGACKISWKDGGMIRSPDKTAAAIKSALEGLLVGQVLSKGNSSLTDAANNGINNKDSSDSAPIPAETDSIGESEHD